MANSPRRPFTACNFIVDKKIRDKRYQDHIERIEALKRQNTQTEQWHDDFEKHKLIKERLANETKPFEVYAPDPPKKKTPDEEKQLPPGGAAPVVPIVRVAPVVQKKKEEQEPSPVKKRAFRHKQTQTEEEEHDEREVNNNKKEACPQEVCPTSVVLEEKAGKGTSDNEGPLWIEDVSDLLVTDATDKNLWKILAKKIGITPEDISKIEKKEASVNPFLEVFKSLFVGFHAIEAREATFKVLQVLKEEKLDDAIAIIQTTIGTSTTEPKPTEAQVDEHTGSEQTSGPQAPPALETIQEVATLPNDSPHPAVFISYQWASQKEVVCLYRCLTELGFNCWIDVEQVKVGDDLYTKLYEGVSNCKILISCITPAYTKSDNCRREIAIAHEKKKQIIPLILEKTDVSSIGGSVSFIMATLLYFECAEECKRQWRDPNDTTKFAPKQLQDQLCKELKLEIEKKLSEVEELKNRQTKRIRSIKQKNSVAPSKPISRKRRAQYVKKTTPVAPEPPKQPDPPDNSSIDIPHENLKTADTSEEGNCCTRCSATCVIL